MRRRLCAIAVSASVAMLPPGCGGSDAKSQRPVTPSEWKSVIRDSYDRRIDHPEGRHYSCRVSGGGSVVLVDQAAETVAAVDRAHMRFLLVARQGRANEVQGHDAASRGCNGRPRCGARFRGGVG